MDDSQLSDLRIGQTIVDSDTVFQDREFRKNILGVVKGKFFFIMSIFEFGGGIGFLGRDVQNSGGST